MYLTMDVYPYLRILLKKNISLLTKESNSNYLNKFIINDDGYH